MTGQTDSAILYEIYWNLLKIQGAMELQTRKKNPKVGTDTLRVLVALRYAKCNTRADIAKNLSLGRQTVSTIINGLIKQGHVTETNKGGDKRSKYIKLTNTGNQYALRIIEAGAKYLSKQTQQMTREDKQKLLRLLKFL